MALCIPKKSSIHELVFKGSKILVYSGPRPSAFVDRNYNFTLDLSGKLIENDVDEKQKQKNRDLIQGQIKKILKLNLVNISPTIEIWRKPRNQDEKKALNSVWKGIMKGQYSIPAIYATIQQGTKESEFMVFMEIFGRTPEERDETTKKLLKRFNERKEEFRNNGLILLNEPGVSNVPSFRGSGPYPRSSIFIWFSCL